LFSPSLRRKEGECICLLECYTPSLLKQRGGLGGEFMGCSNLLFLVYACLHRGNL
jgi:hypothetical protein